MCHLDENGKEYGYQEVDGQFKRLFTQQSTADLTFTNKYSMATMYKGDRDNAKASRNGKQYYPRVPFPTDRDLRRYSYPFKSGYYFNPAGTYTFTINTVQYKNSTADTDEHRNLVNKVIDGFHYQSNLQYTLDGRNTFTINLTPDNNRINNVPMLKVERDYDRDWVELPHVTDSDGTTHQYFKEILEGYNESNTENSKDNFKYREYIKDGQHIYKVIESTTVTITVNPTNTKLYTYANMRDGEYLVRAWLEDFTLTNYGYNGLKVSGKNGTHPLDQILVTVKGSMFDDLNN